MTINEGYAQQSIKSKVSDLFKISLTPQQHDLHEVHASHNAQGNNSKQTTAQQPCLPREISALFSFSTRLCRISVDKQGHVLLVAA